MNCFTWLCSVGVGVTGYEAVIEWRSVQEDRPSCSTSGGQSDGGPAAARTLAGAPFAIFLLCDAQSEKEVHDRQLEDD